MAFYEYWRESADHKEIVMACRKARVFEPGYKGGGLRQEMQLRIARRPDIFPISVIMLLAKCDGFPELASREVKLCARGFSLAMEQVGVIPWRAVIASREARKMEGCSEDEFFEEQFRGTTLHAFSIPWRYTDVELANMFLKLIPRLRPPEFPEPRKAGRKGRYTGSGVVDMLRQLAALRLQRAGVDFEGAKEFKLYGSAEGWKKALRTARERISSLRIRPLFR